MPQPRTGLVPPIPNAPPLTDQQRNPGLNPKLQTLQGRNAWPATAPWVTIKHPRLSTLGCCAKAPQGQSLQIEPWTHLTGEAAKAPWGASDGSAARASDALSLWLEGNPHPD